jgi:cathepsin L
MCALATRPTVEEREFNLWKQSYGIQYASQAEQSMRMQVFLGNLRFIKEWNSVPGNHRVAMNIFGDLTADEYKDFIRRHPERLQSKVADNKKSSVPTEATVTYVDWRTKGAVGPVRDEGQMSDVCSITIAEAIEGCAAIASKKFVLLSSEQVDVCTNDNCESQGWQYVVKAGGLGQEGSNVTCASKSWAATITGFQAVQSGSEKSLEAAVNITTPQCALDSSLSSFQFYSAGVYSDPNCSSQQLDHEVITVGYGSTSGQNFWILKNSWGTDWGMMGYMQLAKDSNNMCGIATMATYGTGCF